MRLRVLKWVPRACTSSCHKRVQPGWRPLLSQHPVNKLYAASDTPHNGVQGAALPHPQTLTLKGFKQQISFKERRNYTKKIKSDQSNNRQNYHPLGHTSGTVLYPALLPSFRAAAEVGTFHLPHLQWLLLGTTICTLLIMSQHLPIYFSSSEGNQGI